MGLFFDNNAAQADPNEQLRRYNDAQASRVENLMGASANHGAGGNPGQLTIEEIPKTMISKKACGQGIIQSGAMAVGQPVVVHRGDSRIASTHIRAISMSGKKVRVAGAGDLVVMTVTTGELQPGDIIYAIDPKES